MPGLRRSGGMPTGSCFAGPRPTRFISATGLPRVANGPITPISKSARRRRRPTAPGGFRRDGGVYANSAIDDNWQLGPGTASRPVVICRTGPNGYNDRSLPPPKMEGFIAMGGTEYGGNGTMHYCEVFGLNFYANYRDPISSSYSKSKRPMDRPRIGRFSSAVSAAPAIIFSS